ncbi:hypothetical protein [Vibrio gazogenes]|uniref:Uncharacterized protein n=1 Tax=Vibrio gazogenes TaxID=687 RepID=A0A1Z2SL68_VIBGA|nr:hypothetical protein [Vibrio gazogenes]ASA57866.1 hypothetical protein BSQ33_19280 [Vibrio gazogenes]
MERYTYEEIIESVEEDFQSSFKLGDDHVAATMRLLGDFYKDIIQSNSIENLMFHVAICLYLKAQNFSIEHMKMSLVKVIEDVPLASIKDDLEVEEFNRLQNDLNQVQAFVSI